MDRGDINLRPGTTPLGKINAQTRSGEVTLSLPPSARFRSSTATTSRGDVTNDFGSPIKTNNEGRGSEMTGSTGAGSPSVDLHTEHGNVTVRRASADDKVVSATSSDDDAPREIKTLKPLKSTAPIKKTDQ